MRRFSRIILSLLLLATLLVSTPTVLTANAAAKNTVKTSVSKVVSKAKGFTVTWKKKSGVKGYQIQYSTSSKFTKSTTKTKTVSGASKVSATISKLKGCNTTYYVRIRTYKTISGKTVYSAWSSVKKVSTLNHSYTAATCTKAKTCKYCGKTTVKALGHKWASATCTKVKTCTRCKKTTGKSLGHKYAVATCTKAKTCTRCKKTSGSALGHKYSVATCTKAKTCTRCAKTSGSALGHNYSAATCTTAAICSRCEKTSGSALGHTWSSWTTVITAEVGKSGKEQRACSICNNIETREIPALQEDLVKKWFVNQYAIAKQQYIDSLNSSISTKQARIDDLQGDASALYVNYMKEVQKIRERYAGAAGTLECALRDAQLNYQNSAQVYTNQINSLESEIANIESEIANPNVDNILVIVTKNCNISSLETYQYYYKYSDSLQ